MKGNSLNENSHDSGQEEESNRIFQGKAVLVTCTGLAVFKINQVVDDERKNEFVEENDESYSKEDDNGGIFGVSHFN